MGKAKGFTLIALGALGGASYVTCKFINYMVNDESATKAFKTYISDKLDGTIKPKTYKPKIQYVKYTKSKPVDPNNFIFDSIEDAESVLERMNEFVDMYGMVSVADICDLAGITSQYTDQKYGWMNLRNAEIVRAQDSYIIKLPKVMLID